VAVFGFLAPMLLLMKIPIIGPLLFLPVRNRCCTLGVGLVGCNVSCSLRAAAFRRHQQRQHTWQTSCTGSRTMRHSLQVCSLTPPIMRTQLCIRTDSVLLLAQQLRVALRPGAAGGQLGAGAAPSNLSAVGGDAWQAPMLKPRQQDSQPATRPMQAPFDEGSPDSKTY
jgi:hypothetical protein